MCFAFCFFLPEVIKRHRDKVSRVCVCVCVYVDWTYASWRKQQQPQQHSFRCVRRSFFYLFQWVWRKEKLLASECERVNEWARKIKRWINIKMRLNVNNERRFSCSCLRATRTEVLELFDRVFDSIDVKSKYWEKINLLLIDIFVNLRLLNISQPKILFWKSNDLCLQKVETHKTLD